MTTNIIITESLFFTEKEMETLHTYWGIYKSARDSDISLKDFIAACVLDHDSRNVMKKAHNLAVSSVI